MGFHQYYTRSSVLTPAQDDALAAFTAKHGLPARLGAHRCPFHDDSTPSLTIKFSARGNLYWRCHAGCGWGFLSDVVDSAVAALPPRPRVPPEPVAPTPNLKQLLTILEWAEEARARTAPYYALRGISTQAAREFWVGYLDDPDGAGCVRVQGPDRRWRNLHQSWVIPVFEPDGRIAATKVHRDAPRTPHRKWGELHFDDEEEGDQFGALEGLRPTYRPRKGKKDGPKCFWLPCCLPERTETGSIDADGWGADLSIQQCRTIYRHEYPTLWPPPEWLCKPDLPSTIADWPPECCDRFDSSREALPDDLDEYLRDDVAEWQARRARQAKQPLLPDARERWLILAPGELKALAYLGAGMDSVAITWGESDRWTPGLAQRLSGRRIAIAYDDDDAGHRFAESTIEALDNWAAVLELRTFTHGTID